MQQRQHGDGPQGERQAPVHAAHGARAAGPAAHVVDVAGAEAEVEEGVQGLRQQQRRDQQAIVVRSELARGDPQRNKVQAARHHLAQQGRADGDRQVEPGIGRAAEGERRQQAFHVGQHK
jgi:hypothetical protein